MSAEAVHYHERVTSDAGTTSTTQAAILTISAADLSGAGFRDNDEVIALIYVIAAQAGTGEVVWRVTYNGAVITSGAATPRINCAPNERNQMFLWTGNLGTLASLTVDRATGTSGQSVSLSRVEAWVIKASEFGVENTDWVRNKSTTNVAHTATYSGTSRAAVTIPATGADQDWVVWGYGHFAIDNTTDNNEARLMVDGALQAGDFSEEGETTAEEICRSFLWMGTLTGGGTHTVAIESRDDVLSTANDHRESVLLAFKKNIWSDIFYNAAGTTVMTTATDTQVGTVTNSLSATQDLLIWGQGNSDINTISEETYMWLMSGGANIDPIVDDASGQASNVAMDATDELQVNVLGRIGAASGTLDIDLMAHHTAGANRNLLLPRLLVMGMNKTATPSIVTHPLGLSRALLVT